MKNKKGFTLIEIIITLALLSIVGMFMINSIIFSMRVSIEKQIINEARIIGTFMCDYIKEELKYAKNITVDNNTGYRQISGSTLFNQFNGTTVIPSGSVSISVNHTYSNDSNKYDSLDIILEVLKNGSPLFSNSFFVKNVNQANTQNIPSNSAIIYYESLSS